MKHTGEKATERLHPVRAHAECISLRDLAPRASGQSTQSALDILQEKASETTNTVAEGKHIEAAKAAMLRTTNILNNLQALQ